MDIRIRTWWAEEIIDAEAAMTRASVEFDALLKRGAELKGQVDQIRLENTADSSIEQEVGFLRKKAVDLERVRQRSCDLWDEAVSLMEGFTQPGGWLHIQRKIESISDDERLFTDVSALRVKFDEEIAGAIYDAATRRASIIVSAIDDLQAALAAQVAHKIRVLEENEDG